MQIITLNGCDATCVHETALNDVGNSRGIPSSNG